MCVSAAGMFSIVADGTQERNLLACEQSQLSLGVNKIFANCFLILRRVCMDE